MPLQDGDCLTVWWIGSEQLWPRLSLTLLARLVEAVSMTCQWVPTCLELSQGF